MHLAAVRDLAPVGLRPVGRASRVRARRFSLGRRPPPRVREKPPPRVATCGPRAARVTTRASTSSADRARRPRRTANQPADGVRRRAIRRPRPPPVPSRRCAVDVDRIDEPDDARCPERSPRKPSPAPRAPNEAAKTKNPNFRATRTTRRRVVRVETRRAASTRATSQRHALQVQSARDSKDPFDEYGGILTAEQEAELGGRFQELLRVEAMEKRLADESIARELRQESEAAAGRTRRWTSSPKISARRGRGQGSRRSLRGGSRRQFAGVSSRARAGASSGLLRDAAAHRGSRAVGEARVRDAQRELRSTGGFRVVREAQPG